MKKAYSLIATMVLLVMISPISVDAQNKLNKKKNYTIYLDIGKLDSTFCEYVKSHHLQTVQGLSMGMIDKNRDGIAELNVVKRYVKKKYLNKNDSGILIIDWEGKAYKHLKVHAKNPKRYPHQVNEYIKVVETIKKLRPNVKVGIYSIPFRQATDSKIANPPWNYKSLYPLLKKCDILFPSLYELYEDFEWSERKNKKYMTSTILTALKLGKKLNKPVIPYVGNRYYAGKSKYSWQLVPLKIFKRDMKYIVNTSYKRKYVSGLLLWNGDRYKREKGKKSVILKAKHLSEKEFLNQYFSTIKRYISILESLKRR